MIRPLNAMVGDRGPLYVVDDAPVMVDSRRSIDWLEPEDILRIRVLKDIAETAVYGPRGVNGVLLITTKQGKRARTREP